MVAIQKRMVERGDRLFTSTLTVGEILVKPFQLGEMVDGISGILTGLRSG